MPLINCPECNTEVSNAAISCVKCGVQLRQKNRTLFGKIVKFIFVIFNILMAFWMFSGLYMAGDAISGAESAAEQAGAAIGTGFGVMMVLAFWAFGDLILGMMVLFTRPK